MRGIKILSLSMALLAALSSGFTAAAADDLTPPAALSSPGGMVYATVGEPVEFTVCGESFVGGEIEIDPIDAPDWIGRARGDGDCETYTATPDTPGVHTLWFRIVDDENDMETAYAVTIEAAPRGTCTDPPTCEWSPPEPLVIVAGTSSQVDLLYSSDCDDAVLQVFTTGIAFPFHTVEGPFDLGNGEFSFPHTFSPDASDVGMYQYTATITDTNNGQVSMCTLSFEVVEPICDVSPTCSFDPPGPIKLTVGQTGTVHFDIFTSCVDHDVDLGMISGDADFCQFVELQPLGAGAMRATFSCTPTASDVGMRTLTVSGRDTTNNLTTQCSLMIEVNQSDACMEPPTCGFEPAGPVKIVAGQTEEIKFSWRSQCPDSTANILNPSFPSFCQMSPITTLPDGTNCFTLTCTPGLNDVGMHTINQVVQENSNQMETTCSISIEVNAPDGCFDPPTCGITPSGPITIRAGQTEVIEFCASPGCDVSTVAFVNPSFPAFCDMSMGMLLPDGSACFTLTCSPGVGDIGMYTINQIVEDQTTFEQNTCSIMIEVIEPCDDPPVCTNTPDGPLMAYVGEEFSFEICGDSLCEADIEFTPLNLPDWCSDADMRFIEHCVEVTCTPPNNVEGMYTFEFELLDTESMLTTTCSVDVEVVCHLEPECYFTESGPIEVAVGEEIDFEFCGVAACLGHKARIEMTSRPPFIDPAGHQKGGPDELLCLPIQGTPGPEDVGYWNVRITTEDLDTGVESECSIQIIVTGSACPPPVCTVGPSESMSAVRGQQVMLTACGEPGCLDGTVRIEAIELPAFCDPFDAVTGEQGEELCVDLSCTIPMDTPDGEYPVVIRVTDLDSGEFTDCGGAIVVGPPPACIEEEPNNVLGQCTVLDARSCLNIDCGAFIAGYLDDSGEDVDFYCVEGLQPGGFYNVQVINGVSCDLEPTCAMALCVDDQGTRIGPGGSEGSECIADDNGTLLIGVTGCGDYDLDGQADDEVEGVGGIGHGGRGSYQLLFSLQVPAVTEFACHADMNGDGIVDAGDLGLLIGVFGETCNP